MAGLWAGQDGAHRIGQCQRRLVSPRGGASPLNPLAFAFHAPVMLAWKQAVDAKRTAYQVFEHVRTTVVYIVSESWDHLLRSIAAAAIRPPG